MTRYCPNCGAVVPKGSINCRQCFTEVPRDDLDAPEPTYSRRNYERPREEYEAQIKKRKKSLKVALALAVIPAFFGLLGLGQIYEDYRDGKGWKFLAAGLVLFTLMVLLITMVGASGILGAILLAVPLLIFGGIYVCTAIVSVAEVYFGSFRMFGLRF